MAVVNPIRDIKKIEAIKKILQNSMRECALLPCEKWYQFNDPTMGEEENKLIDKQRIELLKSL